MQLTEHFTEDELGVVGAEDRIKRNAKLICTDLLEPLRIILGPLIINDGRRNIVHNKEVGGVQNSFHLYNDDECAVDFVPENYNLQKAFDYIRLGSKLNFDKVILEYDKTSHTPRAIHIQYHCVNTEKNMREAYEGFTHGAGDYTKVVVI